MTAGASGRQALIFVAITVLLDSVGFGLIIPVMPALLVELSGEGLSRAALYGGWLGFAYAAMQFLCAPVLGNLSDRYGRRPVLLLAIGTLGVDYLIMGFAPTLAWLFLGRTIAGIAGASFTPAYAYVADISPPGQRAQNFGIISAGFGVGFILGPALGGLLGGLGPRAPFFAAAALSLVNVAYGALVLPESLPPDKRRSFDWKRANPLGTLLQVRKHPVVFGLLVALFLWLLANQVMPATWAFYTKFRFDWSEATIGASLALAGLVMVLAQTTFLRVIVPRIGERRAALIGIVMGAVGYAGYGTATAGWMMFAWLVTWFFGANRDAQHQRAHLAPRRGGRAGGTARRGREPLFAFLDHRAAAHDPALRSVHRAGCAGAAAGGCVLAGGLARGRVPCDLLGHHPGAGGAGPRRPGRSALSHGLSSAARLHITARRWESAL